LSTLRGEDCAGLASGGFESDGEADGVVWLTAVVAATAMIKPRKGRKK